MVFIIGALLIIAIASVTGEAAGAAANNTTECVSPLEVVGLDDCPELTSGGGLRHNSIVEKLLFAKADMLRQIMEVVTDPASAGQGGRLDEPLLLVQKLAVDEEDANFGSWEGSPGGFNRWVGAYHRKILGSTRPVLVTVHGDDVCALEKELSLEARMKAAGVDSEGTGADVENEESSVEATMLPESTSGGNSTGEPRIEFGEEVRENFDAPVVLMTLGWDPAGDPTHNSPGRDLSCALRVLEMNRVVKWFTSHKRRDSHTHEKIRYLPIGFGGYGTRSGLPQKDYIDAAKHQLDVLNMCPAEKTGSYDLLFQCSNLWGQRDGIWKEMAEGKGPGSPVPVNRFPLEPADMVVAAAKGVFAVSPPGTGADCFRHYEMVLEGNIALVPDEPSLRIILDGLPVFFFGGQDDAWGSLTCGRLLEMAERVQAKIREGKEGGEGLQFEKLTHGFWRRYIRREVLRAGGVTDENAVYVERSSMIMR